MTEWLDQQRAFNAAAKQVLAQAEAECVRLADSSPADALKWAVLATVATDIDSRKPLVDVIRTGLAAMTQAWADLAEDVALGRVTEEDADTIVASLAENSMREAILSVEWPGLLNINEVTALSTLMDWLAEEHGRG